MQYPRIHKAIAVEEFTLLVEFTNKAVKPYDIHRLLHRPMFAPLCQPAFFKSFQIAKGGYGLVWNEDIDISEYELWQNGTFVENEALVKMRQNVDLVSVRYA